jgi:diguanylate cyclase (GGDEF)-like protein
MDMSAALSHRGALVAAASGSYAAVAVAFVLLERPGLGIGHFFYLPVALLALAGGTLGGAAAGALATTLYAVGMFLNPEMPVEDIVTLSTAIRCITFVASGALVGAFAAAHRELIERLSETSQRDFLTGLMNTRAFEAEIQRRCTIGSRFTLILGDLDGLKSVNDNRGHAEGNALLRRVARALRDATEEGDFVARVGGDEFAVLAAQPTTDGAAELCKRLEAIVGREGIGMSFGWAVHPVDGGTAIALYRRADERLYSSKETRRSRAEIRALLPRRIVSPLREVKSAGDQA